MKKIGDVNYETFIGVTLFCDRKMQDDRNGNKNKNEFSVPSFGEVAYHHDEAGPFPLGDPLQLQLSPNSQGPH